MEGYHEALMRRLQMIDELGANATMLQQARQTPQPQINLGPTYTSSNYNTGGGGAQPTGSFGKFLSAISGQESGGNYGARNRDSGAMGKYQIMPANIQGSGRGWDYEALGRDISVSQFMKSPQLQESIAQYKLRSYYNKWGPAGAAVAWYAGPGMAPKYMANPGKYTNPQGSYPSIASYVNMIMGKMR